MKTQLAGIQIKAARLAKQWRASLLARHTGISRSRLSKFESGLSYPNPVEWCVLREHLDLGPYPKKRRLELPPVRRRWFPLEPASARAERPFAVRLSAARRYFGHLADRALVTIRARQDEELCFEFLERALLESGPEAMFWMILLASGATPGRHSPNRAGFRKFSILDTQGSEVRGDLKRPCLDLNLPEWEVLFFHQVTLDTRTRIYRLDALACVWSLRNRIWLNIEIDGHGHDGTYDRERQSLLELPTVRISMEELGSKSFFRGFVEQLCRVAGLSEAS